MAWRGRHLCDSAFSLSTAATAPVPFGGWWLTGTWDSGYGRKPIFGLDRQREKNNIIIIMTKEKFIHG